MKVKFIVYPRSWRIPPIKHCLFNSLFPGAADPAGAAPSAGCQGSRSSGSNTRRLRGHTRLGVREPGRRGNRRCLSDNRLTLADQLIGVPRRLQGDPVARMTMQGDVMRMRRITGVDLPAGKAVTLQPSGIHITVMSLRRPLREGQSFRLTSSRAVVQRR